MCIPARGQYKQGDLGMVQGRETKTLHSVNQRKGHANARKREPEQKGQCEAAQATMDLTLEAVYTAEGTWAHF